MPNQSLGAQVQERLTQAVESGLLPDEVSERAGQILNRLQQPVRLAVLGRPGAGKSALVNLLIGREVLPDDFGMPTTQIVHGEKAGAICTLSDGSKQELDTANAYDISELKPVFVELRLPLAALKKISVLEVVTPDDPNAIHKASQWASKRCELAIWCTETFDTNEQAIWAQMPDVLKDHAFLMLTKSDVLSSQGTLEQILDATKALVGHEFNDILPISTLDAISARRLDGTVDKELMRRSGGSALISAVLKQVEMGRQSDVDMADVLLLQNADHLNGGAAAEVPEEDSEVLQAVIGAAASADEDAETPAPASENVAEPAVAPEEEAQDAAETVPTQKVAALHPATREAYAHVVSYLTEQAQALSQMAADLGDAAPTQIIAETVEHTQWMSDYLSVHGDDADEALQRARDAAFDAADLVQLMQMEKRDSAAIEAVSVMLQIKRELQADLAA
ncbi:hypothetical protein SLH49_00940 [Cognatiyoonia sp. IB215446]|uniref:hypothetical protein n=1 Tax=Cognatiyoonia sp. IB215446 TaxID=3097355 RepID=UPI002A16AD4A|nr:hypothetical protein [Cognatiyoonia sp. IB215446]MDX8346535.1 hypothetical protein [Cognatiyoonia sp. IB215446]